MKCAYKQIQDDRRQAKAQTEYDKMSVYLLRALDYSAAIALHNRVGFGKTRLHRFYEELMFRLWDDVEFYKPNAAQLPEYRSMFAAREKDSKEREQNRDSIASTFFSAVQQLHQIGYDFRPIDRSLSVTDEYLSAWRPERMKKAYEGRLKFIRDSETTPETYIACTLLYMHSDYGCGAARLKPLHREIREQYNRFVNLYLEFKDAEALAMIDQLREQVKSYGVEAAYWDGETEEEGHGHAEHLR